MENVKAFILSQVANRQLGREDAKKLLLELSATHVQQDIAVIGLAGRFAAAPNVDRFWEYLSVGHHCIRDFPQARKTEMLEMLRNPYYTELILGAPIAESDIDRMHAPSGYLDRIDQFDARFFGIPPLEADYMDPHQRIALEVAQEALENAGYGGDSVRGSRTGVFLGRDQTNHSYYRMLSENHPMQLAGSWEGLVASRISYQLDLKGPSLMTDTACSAGAVCIHQAIQSLLLGECDMALAGGINLSQGGEVKAEFLASMSLGSVESHDDLVRTFDAEANGTLWGEGAGIVLLKPLRRALADRDHIRAVIKSSAVNNDGASTSITAPDALMQEKVILDAWAKADIDPETLSYVEAHGTGTVLGDPIEIKGLTNAFRKHTSRKQFCGIGSLKTTAGHLVAASGAASIAKVVKSLETATLAPSANFSVPNPFIDFTNSPLYVNDRLTHWESGGGPRRAGISSFGFIRTNCHMVLEEAPKYASEPARRSRYPFTLSAMSEAALGELLDRYAQMLAGECPWSLADICYTSSLGRGHYEHRVLIVASDKAELAQSLDRLRRHGPGTDEQRGVFHGVHAVVSDKKTSREQGDLTAREARRLSDEADAALAEHRAHGEPATLAAAATAYVRGATVDFGRLYTDEARRRVPLPTYPFERTRHWAKPMKTQVRGFGRGPEHPLLGVETTRTADSAVFENSLSAQTHWVLADHRIDHRPVVPGTTYLEMARAAYAAVAGSGAMRFENVFFLTPLAVEEGTSATVRTVLDRSGDAYAFRVESRRGDEWLRHVEGRVGALAGPVPEAAPDLEAARRDATEVLDPYPAETDTGVFQFGPRWDSVRALWRNAPDGRATALLGLPAGTDDESAVYGLHPAKLDNAVNLISQNSGQTFLPYMYKRFELYGPMPATFHTTIRTVRDDSRDGETITYDVDLTGADGRVFARITDYTVKKVDWERFSLDGPRRYLETVWVPAPAAEQPTASDAAVWAVLASGTEEGRALVAEVTAQGHRTVPAYLTGTTDAARDSFAPDDAGMSLLCERLRSEGVQGILFATDLTADKGASHEERRARGVDALFALYQGLLTHRVKPALGLRVLGRDTWDVGVGTPGADPYAAATSALALVIGQEHLAVGVLDAGTGTDLSRAVRESLGTADPLPRALRGSATYVRELRRAETNETPDDTLYRDGTFLITGGTGGLGLALAQEMARQGAARILLAGRRRPTGEAAARIRELAGAEHVLCDVSRAQEVRELGDRLRAEGVVLTGVVHAAGIAGDGFLATKEASVFRDVLAAKVDGSVALLELTRQHRDAFLVFFSSITALTGGRGQGDYCAANAFMDSLAARARSEGIRALSVNWPSWTEVGMAAAYGLGTHDAPFVAVSVERGLSWLAHFVAHPASGVVPSEVNPPVLKDHLGELPFRLGAELSAALENAAATAEAQGRDGAEARLTGQSDPTPTELRVGGIYGAVLGLAEVDAHTSFQDLGGNSLVTAQLLALVDEAFPGAVDIADLFSYATVADLAGYIDEQLPSADEGGKAEPDARENASLLEALDEIGDAELTSLFAESDVSGGN
ncbi:SDR family NAD(P)-dependent oxidoreductase [Streptomyces sp. MCL20-2]|uniref:SDR family NAD(P)-dependent oxidoreductase n=1 Tax=Streptomyces sp. MCL20-2 TaxID=2967219 RepID=UPI002965F42E|nr:SDR family NAD(P)-dependent oxidoreductase [Streptomyces sp. MCL20-2]